MTVMPAEREETLKSLGNPWHARNRGVGRAWVGADRDGWHESGLVALGPGLLLGASMTVFVELGRFQSM